MKKILLYMLCFLMTWINISYAASSFENAPKLISSTDSSLNISWEKIDNADWYYVYYSEKSWSNYKTYWDVYEDTKATLSWLKPSTSYYIVVAYIDKTTNEEWPFSPEWTFNTKNNDDEKFTLDEVKVINASNLELSFNSSLDKTPSALKEFKITQNNKEVIEVKEVIINEEDDKKLNLILNNKFKKGEYKITVIYLTDSLWRNIEEWINWELKFTVNDSNLSVAIDNNTSVSVDLIEENQEYNSWDWVEVSWEYYWLAWKTMTWVLSSWDVIWNQSTQLPKTWPESILLVFISMISWLIYIRKRKTI